MTNLIFNEIHASILKFTRKAGRSDSDKVHLLAVSKKKKIDAIHELYIIGQRHFGENYLQEALEKQDAFRHKKLCQDIHWHFIGPIQSNKTRAIAENFSWVHSVDRLKIAQRLSNQRPPHLGALQICLQVNIDEEQSKSGALPKESIQLAQTLLTLPRVKLRGLMVIPSKNDTKDAFARTQALFKEIKSNIDEKHQKHFDTLSMGMSSDYEDAIAHGATIIRIGTLLFGERG